jgi:hypothetical protein
MEVRQENIEFVVEELQALHATSNLADVLKICFMYGSEEAYLALCSIVAFGKDLASPSKRIKRDARLELYSRIVSVHFPNITQKQKVKKSLTYVEFALALQTFSDRWSQYPFDELISLAYIIDKEEVREINCAMFVKFIQEVELTVHTHPSNPQAGLEMYYAFRRGELYKLVMNTFESQQLRDKLGMVCYLASQFNLHPLTSLVELVITEGSELSTESVVGFVVQLAAAVNQGMRDAAAAHEAAIVAQQQQYQLQLELQAQHSLSLPPAESAEMHATLSSSALYSLGSSGGGMGSSANSVVGAPSTPRSPRTPRTARTNSDPQERFQSQSQSQSSSRKVLRGSGAGAGIAGGGMGESPSPLPAGASRSRSQGSETPTSPHPSSAPGSPVPDTARERAGSAASLKSDHHQQQQQQQQQQGLVQGGAVSAREDISSGGDGGVAEAKNCSNRWGFHLSAYYFLSLDLFLPFMCLFIYRCNFRTVSLLKEVTQCKRSGC